MRVLAHQGENEWASLPLSHQRKMAEYAGSATDVSLMRQLSEGYISSADNENNIQKPRYHNY